MQTDQQHDPQPEIPANHIPIAQEILYRGIVLPAIRREFHRVRIRFDGPVPHPADGPLIIYLTHSSWWDAYMLFLLYYRVLQGGFQNYIMMEAKQLRAYRFFAWCGAFSIDRKIPGDAERSIAYIANRLKERSNRCLWIFPQGRIIPTDQRPLRSFPGIAKVAIQAGGATLWPVALRYEFRGEQQPEALIACGEAHYAPAGSSEEALIETINRNLTATADRLRDDLLAEQLNQYQVLLHGREGINRWFDAWRRYLPGQKSSSSSH